MKDWFLNFISNIRNSYWLIPLLITLSSILLAIIVIHIDHIASTEFINETGIFFLNSQPAGSRAVLATIASSMLMVIGVTFSMTLVAVSYALSQIGPRLMHNFTRDRINQITLGMFIANFLYCLLILRTILSPSEADNHTLFVPHLGIFIALILTIANIIMFIFFIHHIQSSINISNIITKIGKEFICQIHAFNSDKNTYLTYNNKFPTDEDNVKNNDANIIVTSKFYQSGSPIHAKRNGYINLIDVEALFKFAVKRDCVIELKYQINDFVTKLSPLLFISEKIEQKEINNCLRYITIGNDKNQENSILFLSDKITEIVARALSPSMNDPFTAISCIDCLRSAVEEFAKQKPASSRLYDQNNNLRIIHQPLTLEKFVNHSFEQIQNYVCHDRNTILHLMCSIKEMILHSSNEKLIYLLINQAKSFNQTASERLTNSQDVKKVKSYLDDILTFAELKS